MKHSFTNDYSEVAHSKIMEALVTYSLEQHAGYGLDLHSENAKKLIKEKFCLSNADIHFISGGTQANMLVISYILRPYEGVVCVDTGHINVHETAAVEGSGHKIFTMPGKDGKLYPQDIEKCMEINNTEHMVKIKMAYISNSTEIGTIYTKKELEDLSKTCKKYGLYLFMDGARLSSALTSSQNDVACEDIKNYVDVFYIGGTKIGLMSGEAIVIINDNIKEDFRYHIKNKGAMLAKGFVLGIQFEAAFKDNLYFEMGKHENFLAQYLQDELKKIGIEFYVDSPTNQIFPIVSYEFSKKLSENYDFEDWIYFKDKKVVRFVTSWATKMEDCKELVNDCKKIINM